MNRLSPELQAIMHKLFKFHEKSWEKNLEREPRRNETSFYLARKDSVSISSAMFMPHVENYNTILNLIKKDDVILDCGAGDFRFSMLASQICKLVYAIEINPENVYNALKIIGYSMPHNLIISCGDWNKIQIPSDVTKIIFLVNDPVIPQHWEEFQDKFIFS